MNHKNCVTRGNVIIQFDGFAEVDTAISWELFSLPSMTSLDTGTVAVTAGNYSATDVVSIGTAGFFKIEASIADEDSNIAEDEFVFEACSLMNDLLINTTKFKCCVADIGYKYVKYAKNGHPETDSIYDLLRYSTLVLKTLQCHSFLVSEEIIPETGYSPPSDCLNSDELDLLQEKMFSICGCGCDGKEMVKDIEKVIDKC